MNRYKRIPAKRATPRRIHPERSRPVDGHIRERLTGKAREKRRAEIFERAGGRCEETWLSPDPEIYPPDIRKFTTFWYVRCPNRATEWSHKHHAARKCDCLECGIASCSECHRRRHQPKVCPKKERVGQRDFKKVSA